MIIQHNMLAMNNLYMGKQIQKSKTKNLERLASGYRINRAADDAANMAISEKMQSRIRALARCQNNIEEGISLTQTADGALNEVNEMLNRVNELCVQAANGTNTADDRSKIAEEITQIYDDMDRIFEDTEFNTMKVFRHDGDNYYGPDPEYLYHESVTELPPGDLHSWGAGMFPTKQFDLAKTATTATATLTLKDGINLSDSSTLDGTSFNIKKGSTTYKIQFGTAQSTGYSGNNYYVNTSTWNTDTIPEAFNSIKSSSLFSDFIEDISISGNQVKFTFAMSEKINTITADGNTSIERVPDGSTGNGYFIGFDGNKLDPIDSIPDKQTLKFDTTATNTLKIFGNAAATDDLASTPDALQKFRENLQHNELRLYPDVTIDLSTLQIGSISTVGDLRQAITNAINDPTNNPNGRFEAVYDSTAGTIQLTAKNLPEDEATFVFISENTSLIDEQKETTFPVPLDITSVPAPNAETKATHTIKIPSLANDQIYALNLNGSKYLLYPKDSYPGYTVYSSNHTSKSSTDMTRTVSDLIKTAYQKDYDFSTDADGNLVLTSKALNDNRELNIDTAHTTTLTAIKYSNSVLKISGSAYFTQEYSITLNYKEALGNPLDLNNLYGRGFMLNNKYYQFVNPEEKFALYNSDTTPIPLKNISSYTDLCNAISQVIGTSVTEEPANSGMLVMRFRRQAESDSDGLFSDGGPSGTFTGNTISSGGTAYKNPQTEIDFSKYNVENLNELYGTGFRITCATCPGEFINIMFCHDKSTLDYPDSFLYTDDDGNTNTIHNYMVELKNITHGSQIAANIAEQLKDDLDHFTEVKVSDTNPSILIAQDKRSKDQTAGRGQVMAGVYTNFLYNVDAEKLPNPDDKVGGGRKDTDAFYAYCMIYAGDTQEKPYIAVHLPHFSVENLKLKYPKQPWDSYEEITDVMKRSKNAAEVVSMARSKIGADQNRLEHAFDYAANAEEQIADADSRIKDTDMAEAVTTNAKLTILSNAQEAMLTQILDLPERILPLLQ